uniref:Uncharacterized protein n=1 Tax=Fagus sylvatica TaxID=28930 RepID=A0A2N9J0J8_FAGSY
MCPGKESRTFCHLKPRELNVKLVNGFPDSNKGYDKDYLRVLGEWFTGGSACRSSYGYPNPTRIEVDKKQVDTELVKKVLLTNICIDQRGEPRSAPLLLRYEPQIKSFLEGPTVPRSQAVEVEPRVLYVAQPAEVELPQDHPDLIPSGQVCEMAPPINPFKLMGKTADASPSEKGKGKGKGKNKGAGVGKKLKKPMTDALVPEVTIQPPAEQEPPFPPPTVHDLDESNQGEELQPRKKRGSTETFSIPAEGSSSHFEAWDLALLFGPDPISVRDTILDDSKTEVSAQVAHGLAFAACLPKDIKQWVGRQSGLVFRHITRGLMMSALSKTEQPETSDLFLRANTPLPYPKARLKDSEDEANEEDDEDEGTDDEQGEKDQLLESSQPELTDQTVDAPGLPPSSSVVQDLIAVGFDLDFMLEHLRKMAPSPEVDEVVSPIDGLFD